MSTDENEVQPKETRHPKLSAEDASALSWLARWMGIPLLILIALYYAEPLFRRDNVEVVPAVVHQEVHPYPFPPGTVPPTSLAPPAVPRAQPAPTVEPPPLVTETQLSNAEIVANPIAQPQPPYPPRALEAEKEGLVRLRITIGPDGSVTDAAIVSAQPSGWFDSTAVNAVKRWRYRPSGRTISTEVELEFKLQ